MGSARRLTAIAIVTPDQKTSPRAAHLASSLLADLTNSAEGARREIEIVEAGIRDDFATTHSPTNHATFERMLSYFGPHDRRLQEDFVYWRARYEIDPRMKRDILKQCERADVVIYVGYQYAFLLGFGNVRGRAILVPLVNSMLPSVPPEYRLVFSLARGIGYVSEFERELAAPLAAKDVRECVLSVVRKFAPPPARVFRERYGIEGPLVVWICDLAEPPAYQFLFAAWSALRDRPQVDFKTLAVIGNSGEVVPSRPDILRVSAADETERRQAIAAADVVITPSLEDAVLSPLYEALVVGRPILVPKGNLAASDLVRRSGAGSVYIDVEEFIRGVNHLVRNGEGIGESGRTWMLQRSIGRAEADGSPLAKLVSSISSQA